MSEKVMEFKKENEKEVAGLNPSVTTQKSLEDTEKRNFENEETLQKIRAELKDPDAPVPKIEFATVIKQIVDNMNITSTNMHNDLNNMFQKHVYPTTMLLSALIVLLEEKGIVTRAEVDKKANELMKKAFDEAKEEKKSLEKEVQESLDRDSAKSKNKS